MLSWSPVLYVVNAIESRVPAQIGQGMAGWRRGSVVASQSADCGIGSPGPLAREATSLSTKPLDSRGQSAVFLL